MSPSETPLYAAAAHGHAAVVELLCELGGADVLRERHDGRTAAQAAREGGHADAIVPLLRAALHAVRKRTLRAAARDPRMRVGAVFELPNGQLYTLGPGRRAQKIPHL